MTSTTRPCALDGASTPQLRTTRPCAFDGARTLRVPETLSALLAGAAPPTRRLRTPVRGLSWVETHKWPGRLPTVGTSVAAQEGLRFERAVGAALSPLAREWRAQLFSGLWLKFHATSTGRDWAQPDHFLVLPDRVLLLECKRTQTPDAWHQLTFVYGPLLAWLYPDLPVVGIQVAHYLVGDLRSEPDVQLTPTLRALAHEGCPDELAAGRLLLHCHDPRRLA